MKCDCIQNVKGKLLAELNQQEEYKHLKINSVQCDNEAFIYDDDKKLTLGLSVPFTVFHDPVGRKKKTSVKMIAKYCPFCGADI